MQGNGAEEEEQENKTPPPSPNKAPPSPMHTDQADTQPATSKGAPASPMNDHDANSISRDEDSPPTPAQESRHTIPAQVTTTVTDPGPDMPCTLDHESPGFMHEGTMQRIPHPTQEQRKWTYHVHDLSRVTDHWKTTTELDRDPERESVMEAIASWAHDNARQKDPSELDPDEHIKWLANAYLYFKSCNETKRQKATDMLESLFTKPDTRYHLTALAHNTRIAQVPAIDATIKWTPTVPIPDITGRSELEIIMRKIQSSWPINHEFILEASIVEFLLAFALHAEIDVESLLKWIENCEDTSESAQVLIIRHWQNWMYYTQFSEEELPELEQNVHLYPIILNIREAKTKLLNLDHILTQSYIQPVDRAEEEEY